MMFPPTLAPVFGCCVPSMYGKKALTTLIDPRKLTFTCSAKSEGDRSIKTSCAGVGGAGPMSDI